MTPFLESAPWSECVGLALDKAIAEVRDTRRLTVLKPPASPKRSQAPYRSRVRSGLQSENGYLAVTGAQSERYNLIYQFKVKGSGAKLVNTILLQRSARSETWIEGDTVAGQFCNKPQARSIKCKTVGLWKYPSGGEPTLIIRSNNVNTKTPIRGLSISVPSPDR